MLSVAFLFKLAEGAAAACTLEEVFFLVLAGAETGVDVALDGDVTDVDAFL